jgi:precorrin-2 dehydrogenase / sirohydrochlorin ferrochelatase
MIPLYLDPARARVALIGRGALAVRRLRWLREAGAEPDIWSDAPSVDLAQAAGAALKQGLPSLADLARHHAVWIADLGRDEADAIAVTAASVNVLVNVEDVKALCDFHTPAVVRRGQLTLAAGTGGASPAVARAARERLEEAFPEEWAHALDVIAKARAALRAEGADFDALVTDARARLADHGLI